MRGSAIVNSGTLEINRLKRENKELAELIGHLTLNLERTKKSEQIRIFMKKHIKSINQKISKTQIAKNAGISRLTLHYKVKMKSLTFVQ